jgi:molecular chaperone GrpE
MNRKKHPDQPEHAGATPPAPATPPPAPAAEAPVTPAPQPAQPPPTPHPTGPSPVEIELAACKDRHLRLMADFDNFRKRQTREREDYVRRATEALMQELLPVLDHLELALANAPNKADPLAAGVRMVADQFLGALARFDLKPFQSVGELFDTARHESASELASAEVPAHHVLHQLRCGYLLGGRVLRPAQVVISSGPAIAAAVPATPVCEAAEEKKKAK